MAEIQVAGKKVVLRERFPLRTHGDVVGLLRDVNLSRMETVLPLAIKTIESWEFEGDPAKEGSYQEMDAVSELWPLFRGVQEHILGKSLGQSSAASASSSASLTTES